MAFEIVPGRYFVGFFYFDFPDNFGPFGNGGNFNCLVWCNGDGVGVRDWNVQFRFRYYRDDRVHDHEDVLNWKHNMAVGKTASQVEEEALKWVTISAASVGEKPILFPIRGDRDRCIELLTAAPPPWFAADAAFLPHIPPEAAILIN